MKENNNLRVAISKDFDKANNLKEIKERIEESSKMKKRNMIFKYAGGICCVALIVMGFILFNGKNDIKKIFDNGKDVIYINKVNSNSQAMLDVDIKSLDIDSNSDKLYKDLNESYSFINEISIPSDLIINKKYAIYGKENISDNNYSVLHNYRFIYKTSNSYRKITVSFSKNFEIPRDLILVSDNNKESTINNTKLVIQQYGQTYMTSFKYNNINFDIETRNITENEFISLLQSIIK